MFHPNHQNIPGNSRPEADCLKPTEARKTQRKTTRSTDPHRQAGTDKKIKVEAPLIFQNKMATTALMY